MFGYADESGEPGVKKSDHDYFVFCVVLFKDRLAAEKCSNAIDEFRQELRLPINHEFHFVTDSKKTRPAFSDFIKKLDFEFVSASIKKTNMKSDASYVVLASLVLDILDKKYSNINIVMDRNPSLYKELRSLKNGYSSEYHFSEKESRGNNLIQLADYVTALRARFLKYPQKIGVAEAYARIAKKAVGVIEI